MANLFFDIFYLFMSYPQSANFLLCCSDTQALNAEKGKKLKCSSSEYHLGDGDDHRNKKCVSKVRLG